MEEIPDKNIFMMCRHINTNAFTELHPEYHIRPCRRDELHIWKSMPFDDPDEARTYEPFMDEFFRATYSAQEDLFYERTLFVCNKEDEPVGTCMLWKAYGKFNSIHWLKVLKPYEGKGLGRALLSIILKDLPGNEYPIYLHTQPGSYRAIKLYSDFGFDLLSGQFGTRQNDLEECLPILKQYMPGDEFAKLRISSPPLDFIEAVKNEMTHQF